MAFRLAARHLMKFSLLQASSRTAALSPTVMQSAGTRIAVLPLARALRYDQRPSRSFAVSAVSSSATGDKELSEALAAEIKYERDHNDTSTQDMEPPGDWILTEQPGESLLTLTKKYNGEDILVEFSVNQPALSAPEEDAGILPDGAEDAEPEVDLAINFDASIIKGDQALTFDLKTDGTYVEINHVSLGSSKQEPDEDEYAGPVYQELDKEVQQSFQQYLAERGIDEALGDYILAASDIKEEKEYIKWLNQVKSFIDAPAKA